MIIIGLKNTSPNTFDFFQEDCEFILRFFKEILHIFEFLSKGYSTSVIWPSFFQFSSFFTFSTLLHRVKFSEFSLFGQKKTIIGSKVNSDYIIFLFFTKQSYEIFNFRFCQKESHQISLHTHTTLYVHRKKKLYKLHIHLVNEILIHFHFFQQYKKKLYLSHTHIKRSFSSFSKKSSFLIIFAVQQSVLAPRKPFEKKNVYYMHFLKLSTVSTQKKDLVNIFLNFSSPLWRGGERVGQISFSTRGSGKRHFFYNYRTFSLI